MNLIFVLPLAYLLGSIPFGVIVARRQGVDIMRVGSGNTGATNVWRALGPRAGTLVFLLDVLKGLLPAALARWAFAGDPRMQDFSFLAGIVAVLGHCLSPFLGFRGGKGIATALGALLGSTPWVAAGAFAVFALLMAITRFVSLSSIIAAVSIVPLGILLGDPWSMIAAYVVLALFIVYRHRGNLSRLANGTEPKFEFRKPAAAGGSARSEPDESGPQRGGIVDGDAETAAALRGEGSDR